MATDTDRARLLADLGGDGFTTDELNDLFARAGEVYTDATLIFLYARVLGVDQLLMQAAKAVTYRQGETTENLSDVAKALEFRRAAYERALQAALGSVYPAAAWGGPRNKPTRLKEYPDA